MPRVRLAGVVGWLEQPRVGLTHRSRAGQRTEVGRALLAPALADALRHPAEDHRADEHRRHSGHQQQHRLPVLPCDGTHGWTVARAGARLHTRVSQDRGESVEG
jgi:hypothetical protein